MILSGLKSKSLKAAGFADITELGFINEKWVENWTLVLVPAPVHTSLAIHLDDSVTWQVTETLHHFARTALTHWWGLMNETFLKEYFLCDLSVAEM